MSAVEPEGLKHKLKVIVSYINNKKKLQGQFTHSKHSRTWKTGEAARTRPGHETSIGFMLRLTKAVHFTIMRLIYVER